MTENEPAPDICPTDTSHELTPSALAARSCTAPASAEGQNGDAPEVVGELLFATAEAYDGMQTLRARLSTLQSQPFDLAAATAVVELLSSARWQRARSSWHVLQGAQVRGDEELAGTDEASDEGIEDRLAVADAASTRLSDSLAPERAPTTVLPTGTDRGSAPRGTQRVSDLLLELGTVYGWSGIRRIATGPGHITGIGGQPC
ncbi:hypothetical protein [Kineococcus radiotolerans]|uniref:Uncharacterized protein n=1 Tax=Kineococcus radiotolerans (strain ATCC BAA-149 / DSM 14245 / SRS30216) TaxID=266940 RepID=A6WH05_KINRD|nr:hypothetical protein [Kineococcus radiotolerans]ABS06094.1 hypothetical protein Krad_4635 [Kineococcus radiotolerans SRS30216 = ATCC BAA-149]